VTGIRTLKRTVTSCSSWIWYSITKKILSKAQRDNSKHLEISATSKNFELPERCASFTVGDKIDLALFKEGDKVEVSAISKGKGFQGVVKRHGFHGGPRSHGQKHSEREPGSISGTLRRWTSKRYAHGRPDGGRDRVTVKNLKVVQINPEAGLIMVRGAVPGRKGTLGRNYSLG
jgi:large subunit ribosomal protein L3